MDKGPPANVFKKALAEGRTLVGLWCSLGSPTATEVLAHAGYDWLLLDTEHAPTEVPVVVDQIRATTGGTASVVVRPAWNDAVLIKRILDTGAQTVLVPYVQSVEEAARAVAATRYPPHGNRGVALIHRASGYGARTEYQGRADAEMCVLVQLETRPAVEALEAIAAVPGIDGLFIGPSDLSASLGHLGQPAHPEVQAVIADACARARRVGKPIGILAPVLDDARRYLALGFNYVAVGSDIGLLRQCAERVLAAVRS